MAALMSIFKDTYTSPDVGMLRTSSGKVVMANSAKYPLPLYTAPVLQHVQSSVFVVPRLNVLTAWDASAHRLPYTLRYMGRASRRPR